MEVTLDKLLPLIRKTVIGLETKELLLWPRAGQINNVLKLAEQLCAKVQLRINGRNRKFPPVYADEVGTTRIKGQTVVRLWWD